MKETTQSNWGFTDNEVVALTDRELELKVLERLIVAKNEALIRPPVDRRFSNAHRQGTPRHLFRSMQRDLNRGASPDETARYVKALQQEIHDLKQRASSLALSLVTAKKNGRS